ncbi:MAG: hypothetical protein HY609_06090 [Deltaproteobacteria bacterium]|nr:hypothetical protein [Deltaproteobacteria bacterium]
MNKREINERLKELGHIYDQLNGPDLEIGICGGAALILTDLVSRVTKDVDLLYPLTLPPQFTKAAQIVAQNQGLPANWINQGPKDLFTMGLPENFQQRATKKRFGKKLTAHLAGRKDQIFFKLYAAADRAGYHVDDLKKLKPSDKELTEAVRWVRTHDPSEGFFEILISMLEKLGYETVAQKIRP